QNALLQGFAARLGIRTERGEITAAEERRAARWYEEEIGTDDFVSEIDDPDVEYGAISASHTGPGGTITAHVRLDGTRRDRIREVLFTGDFFVAPPRTVLDLEAALRDIAVVESGQVVEAFFERTPVGLLSVSPADFAAALRAATERGR
ncbi:MAG TPA: hypothetical protein VFP00_00135, partial [Burkholderiales bacterium]|nr:hypothetical protein [Burkholderiales bacterium]